MCDIVTSFGHLVEQFTILVVNDCQYAMEMATRDLSGMETYVVVRGETDRDSR